VAVPIILFLPSEGIKDNDGRDWWSAEGISHGGMFLVIGNIFVGPSLLYFGPDRWFSRLIAGATTQKELNIAYEPPPFDIAEYYGQFILTVAMGLFFSPWVPLTIPATALAITFQYWAIKKMLTKVCKIPPQMSMGYQRFVRHILRGVMLVWIAVTNEVFSNACGGDCSKDDNSNDACLCKWDTKVMIIIFYVNWVVWTFCPCRNFFCKCFPKCILWCMAICSKRFVRVAPEPVDIPEMTGFPMTSEQTEAKELYDGVGSWTYLLPTPAIYGGIDESVPLPPEEETTEGEAKP
jgi:hypothetical protein